MVDSPKTFLFLVILIIAIVGGVYYYNSDRDGGSEGESSAEEEESAGFSFNIVDDVLEKAGIKEEASEEKEEESTPTRTSPRSSTPRTTPSSPAPTVPYYVSQVVYYTSSGFSPQTLQISRGQTVRFLNRSNTTMWVSSTKTGGALNQGKSVGYNQYYDFTFTSDGTYLYHNKNKETHTGIIAVN